MIKHITQPIKVIDNFFEQPQLVVNHAIKQEYSDQDNSLFYNNLEKLRFPKQ